MVFGGFGLVSETPKLLETYLDWFFDQFNPKFFPHPTFNRCCQLRNIDAGSRPAISQRQDVFIR